MSTIIGGSSPSVTFSDSTTQTTAFTGSASQITSGTLPSAQLPTGSVLQVVNANTTTNTSTTSTSFVATAVSTSITPKFSNSKILINISSAVYVPSNEQCWLTIYRNSTELSGSTAGFSYVWFAGQRGVMPSTISYLDSPATTSSTTYTLYFRTTSGTASDTPNNGTKATITLMEIAG